MAAVEIDSGIGGLDKSNGAWGGVEGRSPATSGSERGQGEVFQEVGQVGMTFETTEAGFNLQQGGWRSDRDSCA